MSNSSNYEVFTEGFQSPAQSRRSGNSSKRETLSQDESDTQSNFSMQSQEAGQMTLEKGKNESKSRRKKTKKDPKKETHKQGGCNTEACCVLF